MRKKTKRLKVRKEDVEKPVRSQPKRQAAVVARTENQRHYIKSIIDYDVVLCDGPAGTGKTHIAVGMAVKALEKGQVDKIIIARPAVEAGERTGFLPGDQDKKLDPYMRPIMDELSYYLSYNDIATLKNGRLLEVVPVGYMRGRTFNHSFVIIDECQNATFKQLKMILTRLGEHSKMVLNGDMDQSDLDHNQRGAFNFAYSNFKGREEDGISCVSLTRDDIQRHKLVGKMLEIWESRIDCRQS